MANIKVRLFNNDEIKNILFTTYKAYLYFRFNEIHITIDDFDKASHLIDDIAERLYNSKIYWNDVKCVHFSYDTLLSRCDKWLENITWNNELNKVDCEIYFN